MFRNVKTCPGAAGLGFQVFMLFFQVSKFEQFGELEDFSGMGSVDNDDIFEMEPLPRTSSMLESEERESIRRVDDNR